MTSRRTAIFVLATALLYGAATPLVTAHGVEHAVSKTEMSSMHMGSSPAPALESQAGGLPSYFRHGQYGGWVLAHIALLSIAWVMVMPVAIVLSIARSQWSLWSHIAFHLVNGLGLFAGFVYNHATPDLYTNNSHHPLGWALTGFAMAWTLASVVVMYGTEEKPKQEPTTGNPLPVNRNDRLHRYHDSYDSRWSRDSGHGSDSGRSSLFGHSRQNSSDVVYTKPEEPVSPLHDVDIGNEDDGDANPEHRNLLSNGPIDRFLTQRSAALSSRLLKVVRIVQVILEKTLLLLGFAAICTGFVVYGGFFRSREIFSGLAHFIKGGIFFWYGLLTLGRWMGAFGEFGWAWNVRPQHPAVSRWKTRIPSAEFVESFVIWFYGTSNVFLEHLNNWGGSWSAQDLEHISITLLFFGGGLLGMIIESKWARSLLDTNTHVQEKMEHNDGIVRRELGEAELWSEPPTYRVPLNPMPALTIMLLGMMMSGHHQDSMVSTMMHAQWGGLFTAFAFARAVTYALMYVRPPTSFFAGRPPSELVAAFCLTSGGIMFMVSSHDTVGGIEANGLDAMTIFTVVMGFTGVLLACEIMVFVIKGWAVRKARGMSK